MVIEDSTKRVRILGISGSLREASYNSALLREIASRVGSHVDISIARIDDLPFYNRDVELVGLPEPVSRLRSQIADADAVVLASPEYNWSVTAPLKNAIDWASRAPASPLNGKRIALVGGGGRSGGRRSQRHLREILEHNRVELLQEPEVAVTRIYDAFDDDMVLVDDDVAALLDGFVPELERFAAAPVPIETA